MEGFVVWLIVIAFLIVSSGSKKKKGQQAAKTAESKLMESMPPEAQAKLEDLQAQMDPSPNVPAARMTREERAARIRELRERRAARVANARGTAAQAVEAADAFSEGESYGSSLAGQGQSAYDDEGCVGGSMPHDHSEGERRAEHDAHIAAMRARDEEEAAMAAPGRLAGLDPRDLRRAVVISEVLGKPRALKALGSRY